MKLQIAGLADTLDIGCEIWKEVNEELHIFCLSNKKDEVAIKRSGLCVCGRGEVGKG